MKNLILILSIFIFGSCISDNENRPPFIISYKGTGCEYRYIDKNGSWHSFTDSCGKYDVGDTLK